MQIYWWSICLLRWTSMTLSTAEQILTSWEPSPCDKTDMQRSIFRRLFPSQAILYPIASVIYWKPCPRLDNPSGRVSETIIQFGISMATLLNYISTGFCLSLSLCRPRFRLFWDTSSPLFSPKITSGFYNYPFPGHLYRVLQSLSISLSWASFIHIILLSS